MSANNHGIHNFSKMDDKEKSYALKLLATLIASIIAGIITGSIYAEDGGISLIGFAIFFGVQIGMTYFVKMQYDLSDMTDVQIFRHGIMVGFFSYLFFWTVTFQFLIF